MELIEGRPVVVTGGASGIGRALADEAAARGASPVIVLDVDASAANAVCEDLNARGILGVAWSCDVSQPHQLEDVAARIIAEHGMPALVCANAGITPGGAGVLNIEPDQALWVVGVNLLGTLWTVQAFGRPMMRSTEPGWLLVTGSEHSLGVPHVGIGMYTASKHAVLGLCDVLRAELPAHLGVSVLCPGLTSTGIWASAAHRPEQFGGVGPVDPSASAVVGRGMDPAIVAQRALDGVAAGRFIIPTHYNARNYAEIREAEVREAFDRLGTIDTSSWDVYEIVAELQIARSPDT